MEKSIKLVDYFWRKGDLLPLDYYRPPCKEIVRYHRGIELSKKSLTGIIGMLHKTVSFPSPDDCWNLDPIHCFNVNAAL
ncbi:hypothetical protein ACOSQ2_017352 [Xanthoceras sorbifolium]